MTFGKNPMLFLAKTSVQVLGKEVTDPTLQMISMLTFLPLFLGILALVIASRMVDEERIRAEPSVSKLFGRGLPPRRILTDTGRKIQAAAFVALAIGGVLLLFLIIKTR